MSKEDKFFQSEKVYEQIEQLSSAQSQQKPQSSDAHLISNVRRISVEDREIVERVWSRLAAQERAGTQNIPGLLKPNKSETIVKGSQPMQSISYAKQRKTTLIRLLELSAAILVISALVGGMLFLLQKTHSQGGSPGSAPAPADVTPHSTRPSVAGTSTSVATQIGASCNVAHAATMTPLSGATDPAVFYMTGSGGYQSVPSATSLIRYDLVTGKQTTLVQPASNSFIIDVRLSPDKQWLLLRTFTPNTGITKLQLIRTDGSMLQTVLQSCAHGSYVNGKSAWSPNGQEVAFTASTAGISVLDLATGNLQTFLPGATSTIYQPAFWADNHRLVVEHTGGSNASTNEIDLLDISKGVKQAVSGLIRITSLPAFCGSVTLSGDGSQLFTSACAAFNGNCQGSQVKGPTTVSAVPVFGGATRTVYSSQSHAITALYATGSSSLLMYIENTTGDLSQDGLWKINTDGSGLTRLTTTNAQTCQYSQYAYPLTQISSNGESYALLAMDGGAQKLIAGNLAGGVPTTIVAHQIENINVLLLAGIGVS